MLNTLQPVVTRTKKTYTLPEEGGIVLFCPAVAGSVAIVVEFSSTAASLGRLVFCKMIPINTTHTSKETHHSALTFPFFQ
jgi:hypothetical protein